MELRDLIVTPIVIFLVYALAYIIRPYVTDSLNRKYFLSALTVKVIGAITIGLMYQFYYGGGDTFMYHTYGSRIVWSTIMESPWQGITLLFRSAGDYSDVYKYASQIYFFRDPQSYSLIKLAAFFDVFTLSSYAATASLFAVFSFAGTWALFLTFYKQYPHLKLELAVACCFIPSVFFWGSGILKETIVMACLGTATYLVYIVFITKRFNFLRLTILILSLYYIFVIKIFVLQAFVPALIVWVVAFHFKGIRSVVLKIMLVPAAGFLILYTAYSSAVAIGAGDEKYSIEKIAQTAKVTAYDIRFWSGRDAGSGYTLGELDGTFGSMIRLAPQAINVTLFRPYLWEIKNPLMFLSSIESLVLLIFTCYVIAKCRHKIFSALTNPNIIFALTFSLSFAFAVGVSTFNFGTLVRYKIPLLPFFLIALILILNYSNKDRKLEELDVKE